MIHRPTALRSPKRKRERKRKALFLVGVFALGCAALLAGVSALSHIHEFAISSVRVEGERAVASDATARFVEDFLKKESFELFSRRNMLAYPKHKIEAALRARDARIEHVEFDIENDGVLLVRVSSRAPYATWCGNDLNATTTCYFLDEKGYIFAPAPYFSGSAFVKYFGGLAGDEAVGSQVLDPGRFQALGTFTRSLGDLGLVSENIVLGEEKHEIYFRDKSKIIFNDEQPYTALFENLQSVLAAHVFKNMEESEHVLPRASFDYIDLRFDNRVFYKTIKSN